MARGVRRTPHGVQHWNRATLGRNRKKGRERRICYRIGRQTNPRTYRQYPRCRTRHSATNQVREGRPELRHPWPRNRIHKYRSPQSKYRLTPVTLQSRNHPSQAVYQLRFQNRKATESLASHHLVSLVDTEKKYRLRNIRSPRHHHPPYDM